MDMVGSSSVIEDAEAISLFGLEKPPDPGSAITRELQKKFLLVTPMGDMPDISWQKITMRSRHLPPPFSFHGQNGDSKLLSWANFEVFPFKIRRFARSDPSITHSITARPVDAT
jgi:hypothetical protein